MARKFISASSQQFSTGRLLLTGYPYTMAGWFSTTNPAKAGNQYILNQGSLGGTASADVTGLFVAASNSSLSIVASDSAGSFNVKAVGSALSANTWYAGMHVGIDSTHRIGYVSDGGNVSSATDNVGNVFDVPITSTNVWIGAFEATAGLFDGLLARTALWNVALTAQEFSDFKNGKPPELIRPANLLACWNLNDSGGYASDSGSGRRHAIPSGAPIIAWSDPPQLRSYIPKLRHHMWAQAPAGAVVLTPYNPWPQMAPILAQ